MKPQETRFPSNDIRRLARRLALITFFAALPFLLLFYYIPIPGWHSIGNDSVDFSIGDQIRLFYSISKNSFPLYIPGYVGGQSSGALTLGQIYHPISWVAYLTPGYWNGHALLINTVLRMLSLGVAHYIIYRLFRRLTTPPGWAFICSFIAVYNMRMLDCFRYGAALENYTGFLFACVSLAYIWNEPHKKKHLFALIFSLYWLICGGHPQTAYYGMIGVVIFTAFCPFFCSSMRGKPQPDFSVITKFYGKFIICTIAVILIAAAYLLPLYFDFVLTNQERLHRPYEWSLKWSDNPIGAICSFFMPLRGDVHGNFGGTSLIAITLLIPIIALRKSSGRKLLLTLWSVGAVVFLVMLEKYTPAHYAMWKILPLADSNRTPGRFSIFLPMIIASMLLLLWKQHIGNKKTPQKILLPLLILAVAGIYAYYPFLYNKLHISSEYSPLNIRQDISLNLEISVHLLGILGLLALAAWSYLPSSPICRWILCFCVVIQTGIILSFGTWLTKAPATQKIEFLDSGAKSNLYLKTIEGGGMGRKDIVKYREKIRHLNLSKKESKLYINPPLAIVQSNFVSVQNQDEFFRKLKLHQLNSRLTIENAPQTASSPNNQASITLNYSSYNYLTFDVTSAQPAYIVISYPFMPNWLVWVNDKPTPFYRANGLYVGIPISAGHSLVEIRYQSEAGRVGMTISCVGLILLWGTICLYSFRQRYILFIIGALLIILFFGIWEHSFYNGSNLGTKYKWSRQT